ncbi:MAG: thioredoxin domain-containing protein [Candidatus Aenigmatarchaeota archaeon]|nr:MAG: thioredoxin domain-containing protein [Candidatus Aenigmarchaeota archaeon]
MDVQWFEWGDDAFQKAKSEDKLVLLDISAVWCHWCHRMDADTYADPKVAALLNEKFVPIRVDTDKRPDVNARYNLGGWPTTALLTPDGNLITGATYVPPAQMIQLLEQAQKLYREDRETLEKNALKAAEPRFEEGKPGTHIVEAYRTWLEELYDTQNGGFGLNAKFPQTNLYGLLFALAEEGKGWRDRMVLTLQRMAGGGMFDRIGGGFFRYATQREWTAPHYEKLLEDNSRLVSILLRAYVNLGDKLFLSAAEQTARYMLKTLYDDKEHYFYGSQDADEEYYKLNADERAKRKAPNVDKTLYTDWNCWAVCALLDASVALKEDAYRTSALQTLRTVLEKCFDGERVYHFWPRTSAPATLADATALANALLKAYQCTLEKDYLVSALNVADAMVADFGSLGAFYDVASTDGHGLMAAKHKDADDNGFAATVLLKLFAITGEEKYRILAENALNELAGLVEKRSVFAPQYVEAIMYKERGFVEVSLTGDPEKLGPFIRNVLSRLSERIVIKHAEGAKAEATVCVRETCRGPYDSPDKLFAALETTG